MVRLVTLISVADYAGEFNNKGAVMIVDESCQVCPISMDQVAMLALQLNVPKAWVIDRIYDWILGSRSNHATSRHLKNFKTWLKRQVQVWQQRQGRVGQELTSRGLDPVGNPDSNDNDADGISHPLPRCPTTVEEEMSKGRIGQELTSRSGAVHPVGDNDASDPLQPAPTVEEEMSKALTEEMEDAEVS
eukprot:symbB.v1.2.020709.t2/scaffold1760.1/size102730/7